MPLSATGNGNKPTTAVPLILSGRLVPNASVRPSRGVIGEIHCVGKMVDFEVGHNRIECIGIEDDTLVQRGV
ncbi:uncharacterized protein UBRO_20922 [Ustilago bromivora]|uniref:Uncharacterized protein n=1 Tax=Ustilago bromivora TaxID=307758 RepID=A0A1K0GC84_9BASI|nr:uncharacterized protein UBRO_20922 [Ustilago bromivora]